MMKKLTLALVVAAMACNLQAAGFVAYVKMHDGSIVTFELASLPNPDSAGMYRFHPKTGGDIVVHASNVWFEQRDGKNNKKGK